MHTTASTVIDVPLAQAWDVLADHEGMASWGLGLKVRLETTGAESKNGVGAVRRLTLGPAPAIVEEITDFEPSGRLGYKALSGVPFKGYNGVVELTAVGSKTRVDWTLAASPRLALVEKAALNVVARTLLFFFVRAAQS